MKKQNGITLIALVITIIVLLILAGVSISSILGDDGLIAKARLAAERTKQAQLDEHKQLENIDMEMNGGKIKYEVEQKGAYAVIKLYLHVNGSNTYGDYAIEKLYGTTEEEKTQMILAASAFHAEKGCWSEPAFESIDALVTYWASNYDMYADCTTLDEIVAAGDYDNLVEWMISNYYIDPEVLDNETFDGDKNFTLKSGEAVLIEDGSTYMPYVEIPVTASGTYDFELITNAGTNIKTSVTVNVESNETAFLYETDENDEIVILGLDEKYYVNLDKACQIAPIFDIIAVPSKINGVKVTQIADYAFMGCNGLKKVILPDSITYIGIQSFGGCYDLEEINMPKSLAIIEERAFEATNLKIKKLEFSENLVYIGNEGFWSVENLEEITLPNSLTSVGNYVFSQCKNLKQIHSFGGLTEIPKCMFSGCTSLKSVNLNGIVSIGEQGFSSCTSLTQIEADSLKTIGYMAFYKCGFTTLEIPNTVEEIGQSSFASCTSLKSLTIPNSVTLIGQHAFGTCTSLDNVVIPNSITRIENSTFGSCASLKNVTIPDSVTFIGNCAFASTAISEIYIPDSVTTIDTDAFYSCKNLTEIFIPSSVTTINNYMCRNCNTSLVIKCEASAKQSGWSGYWNYCQYYTTSSTRYSVTYGATR